MYTTNSKHTQALIKEHIMSFTDEDKTIDILLENHIASGFNSVQWGDFLIYYDDIRAFINTLELNNKSNKQFTDEQVHNLYVLLLNKQLLKMIQDIKKQ